MRRVLWIIILILILGLAVGKFKSYGVNKIQKPVVLVDNSGIILTKLTALSPGPVKSDLQNGVLTATLSSGLTIILDIQNLKADWEASLQFILTRSKIAGKVPKSIDMRYASPVINYGQK